MMSQISEAEAVVMEVLWRHHPLGADDVVAALASRDWAEPTTKTLLVAHFSQRGELSAQDIAELKQLIRELDHE